MAVALAPVPARADDAETTAANARFAEGVKLYKAGKYEQARVAFLQAYGLKKQPFALFNLAQASARAGRTLDAMRAFERFLAEAEDATPEQRKKAERAIADAQSKLGKIEVDAPAGADVLVDGSIVGHAPLEQALWVTPGRHEVKLVLGDAQANETVRAAAGTSIRVRLARPKQPDAAPATKIVTKEPDVPELPKEKPEEPAPPGLFSAPESTTPAYVTGALGIAGLSAAVVFGGLGANARKTTIDAQDAIFRVGQDPRAVCASPPQQLATACRSYVDGLAKADRYQTAFVVSLVAGGALVTTAFAWWIFSPKAKAPAADSKIVPLGGPGVAGAVFEGRF